MTLQCRTRTWCFTLNNYTEEQVASIKDIQCVYLVFGKEVGESGTPHLQGYIYFCHAKSFQPVKDMLFNAHIEPARGSPQDNTTYCSKQGDVFIKGNEPHQGKRSDVESLHDDIKTNNPPFVDIIAEHTSLVMRYPTFCQTLRRVYHPPTIRDCLDNQWIYGDSGLGKTRQVWDTYPNLYVKDPKSKWWDGYDNEEVVLLDEVDKECKFMAGYFKTITDHYPFAAEIKGGYIKIRPKTMIFTSNWSIEELFPDPKDHLPLLRRFRVIHKIKFP